MRRIMERSCCQLQKIVFTIKAMRLGLPRSIILYKRHAAPTLNFVGSMLPPMPYVVAEQCRAFQSLAAAPRFSLNNHMLTHLQHIGFSFQFYDIMFLSEAARIRVALRSRTLQANIEIIEICRGEDDARLETVASKWNGVWLEHSIIGSLARALAKWLALPRPVPAIDDLRLQAKIFKSIAGGADPYITRCMLKKRISRWLIEAGDDQLSMLPARLQRIGRATLWTISVSCLRLLSFGLYTAARFHRHSRKCLFGCSEIDDQKHLPTCPRLLDAIRVVCQTLQFTLPEQDTVISPLAVILFMTPSVCLDQDILYGMIASAVLHAHGVARDVGPFRSVEDIARAMMARIRNLRTLSRRCAAAMERTIMQDARAEV